MTIHKASNWFTVDKTGLAKLQHEKDRFFILKELISNSFDEQINRCAVSLEYSDGEVTVEVTDDSVEGFKRLSDAHTLFAESYKKGNVLQRGRFNIGEKLALSLFKEATITSTKGRIIFHKDGTRSQTSTKRDVGTTFSGIIKMTKREMDEIIEQCELIIPPENVTFSVNENLFHRPDVHKVFSESLPTVDIDDEGNLKSAIRKTEIELFKKGIADVNYICELGIPVVETDICFTINVNQKVPMNKDRDNVSPAYLKKLRTYVLNETADELDDDEAKTSWVTEALEDAEPDAVVKVVGKRFGDDAVVFDPSDLEANKKAIASGVNVITGGSLSSKTWDNIRETREKHGWFVPPSGRVQEYKSSILHAGVGGDCLPKEAWTLGMREVAKFAEDAHKKIFNEPLVVQMADGKGASASYSRGNINFYYVVLGKGWFDLKNRKEEIVELIIHEFGHYYSSDHLSERYYDGLCRIGARLYCRSS